MFDIEGDMNIFVKDLDSSYPAGFPYVRSRIKPFQGMFTCVFATTGRCPVLIDLTLSG